MVYLLTWQIICPSYFSLEAFGVCECAWITFFRLSLFPPQFLKISRCHFPKTSAGHVSCLCQLPIWIHWEKQKLLRHKTFVFVRKSSPPSKNVPETKIWHSHPIITNQSRSYLQNTLYRPLLLQRKRVFGNRTIFEGFRTILSFNPVNISILKKVNWHLLLFWLVSCEIVENTQFIPVPQINSREITRLRPNLVTTRSTFSPLSHEIKIFHDFTFNHFRLSHLGLGIWAFGQSGRWEIGRCGGPSH